MQLGWPAFRKSVVQSRGVFSLQVVSLCGLLFLFIRCSAAEKSESAKNQSAETSKNIPLKKVVLPLKPGVSYVMSQGPFGKNTHSQAGNEYSWDFDVPIGSDVISVEDGEVISISEPNQGGGCDKKYSDLAHNIKVKAADGTVAQYVHTTALVKNGSKVKKGQVIAKTSINGFICVPQLHFGIYQSENHLYDSPDRRTLPLEFIK